MTGTAVVRYVPPQHLPWMPATCWGAYTKRARRLAYWRRALFAQHRWQCASCGRADGDPSRPVPVPLSVGQTGGTLWFTFPVTLTLDHVIPIARGGCSHRHNITVLCDQCNNEKGGRLPWEITPGQPTPPHNRRATLPASWTFERSTTRA